MWSDLPQNGLLLSPNLRVLLDVDNLSYETTPTPLQDATRSQGLFQMQFNF